jgi:group I intron endonuclease
MSDTHFIYKITNKTTGQIYIGRTKCPEKRWHMHRRALTHFYIHNAIRAYGAENFTFEVIETVKSIGMAMEREMFYIALFKTNINRYGKEYGYNMTDGGEGETGPRKPLSETHKSKISKSLLIWYANNPSRNIGKPLSYECRMKISAANLGERHWTFNKTPSVEARRNRNESRTKSTRKRSYIASYELRKQLSDNHKRTDFTPFPIEIREKVAEMHDSCQYTYKDMAAALGISINSVQSLLRKKGKPIYPNRIDDHIKDEIIHLRATTKLSSNKIAAQLGIKDHTVEFVLGIEKLKRLAASVDVNVKRNMVRDYEENEMTSKDIAPKYGIPRKLVIEILKLEGIDFAKRRCK